MSFHHLNNIDRNGIKVGPCLALFSQALFTNMSIFPLETGAFSQGMQIVTWHNQTIPPYAKCTKLRLEYCYQMILQTFNLQYFHSNYPTKNGIVSIKIVENFLRNEIISNQNFQNLVQANKTCSFLFYTPISF